MSSGDDDATTHLIWPYVFLLQYSIPQQGPYYNIVFRNRAPITIQYFATGPLLQYSISQGEAMRFPVEFWSGPPSPAFSRALQSAFDCLLAPRPAARH